MQRYKVSIETADLTGDESKRGYSIVAYKPSSEDYCKGCLMDSYGADLEV